MDAMDWALLAELQDDARLSYSELSRRVHLSAPAVAERVRRLERERRRSVGGHGIISGLGACLKMARGAAARDFGCGQGGEITLSLPA